VETEIGIGEEVVHSVGDDVLGETPQSDILTRVNGGASYKGRLAARGGFPSPVLGPPQAQQYYMATHLI
jgi:hypothetical protein